VATVAVAVTGSIANAGGMDWYDQLDKPGFTPPGATFGIVWTILYVMIAVAGWLAWRATTNPRPTVAWAVQMALNLLWSAVFFGLEAPEAGLVVIVVLSAAVAVDLGLSVRVEPRAGCCCFRIWCGAGSPPR